MDQEKTIEGPHKDFEHIKHIDENGVEFWYARELMVLLDYSRWEGFEQVVNKGKKSCLSSGQAVENHFVSSISKCTTSL